MTPTEKLIQEAKRQGFTVYAPEQLTTYFYIVKDDQIGYCQHDRVGAPIFSTVHRANKYNGTGYKVESMEQTLIYRPRWAPPGESVRKYKNAADFLASHWQPLKQY